MDDLTYIKKNFINYIDNIIVNNKVSHAYLIEVDNYDSDFYYIINFVKMIIGNIKYEEMLNSDNKVFKLIDNNIYPDITIISTEQSILKKSLMIDLQKEFNNKSLYNNKKIYIIKEAEKLNDSSANTILKFLEEPEDNIIAFLVTNNRYKVIDTILSRCQILSLKENYYHCEYNDKIFDLIEYILNPKSFFLNYNNIMKNDYQLKSEFKSQVISVEKVFLSYINDNEGVNDNYNKYLCNFSNDYIINVISIIESFLPTLEYNVNFKLWIDSFFLKLMGG